MTAFFAALAGLANYIPFLDRILDLFVFKKERSVGAMEQELKQRQATDELVSKMDQARDAQRARDAAGVVLDDDPDRRD